MQHVGLGLRGLPAAAAALSDVDFTLANKAEMICVVNLTSAEIAWWFTDLRKCVRGADLSDFARTTAPSWTCRQREGATVDPVFGGPRVVGGCACGVDQAGGAAAAHGLRSGRGLDRAGTRRRGCVTTVDDALVMADLEGDPWPGGLPDASAIVGPL